MKLTTIGLIWLCKNGVNASLTRGLNVVLLKHVTLGYISEILSMNMGHKLLYQLVKRATKKFGFVC